MSVTNLDNELLTRCLLNQHRAWEDFVDRFLGLVLHIIDHTASKWNVRIKPEYRNSLCESIFTALAHNNLQLLRNYKETSSLTTYLSVVSRRIVVRFLKNELRAAG